MDYLGQDFSLASEYDSMSVDAIVAEFRAQQAADAARSASPSPAAAPKRPSQTKKAKGEHLSMPSKHRNKRDKQRPRAEREPSAARGDLEYIENEIRTAAFSGPDETPAADAPQAVPSERYKPAAELSASAAPDPENAVPEVYPAASALPEEPISGPAATAFTQAADPVSPAPAASGAKAAEAGYGRAPAASYEKKSRRPSDDEVREFLDAFKRGDFLDLSEHELTNPPVEPDERFYRGGERESKIQYDGVEVDMSADENYSAPKAPDYFPRRSRKEDEADDEDAEEPDLPSGALSGLGTKVSGLFRRRERGPRISPSVERTYESGSRATALDEPEEAPVRKASAGDEVQFESAFSDYEDGDYAVKREYETAPPDYDDLYNEAANPGSFKEYLFSRLTALLYGLRSSGKAGARTMEDDDEDLGREVSCAKASKYYGSYIRSMRLRLRITGILLFVMAWISLGLPVPGMLKTSAVSNAVCLGLQLGIMLLCLDVVTTGVMNAVRGKFGADSMAVAACVLTSLDAALVAKAGIGTPHLALCLISSLSLAGEMFAAVLHARAMRKALRVPAIGKRCFAVTGETDGKTGDVTILKSVRPALGFVRRSEQSSPDEDLFRKISLPLLLLSFALALLIAFAKKDFSDLFYIFSVTFCPAVPFAAMCCYSLPFFLGSMRIFSSGAAIAGWSGMSDIGVSRNLIVTDRDLFPEGTVEVGTIRIFADEDPTVIISYAGSMMAAAGSYSAQPFGELMERNGCRPRGIENFEYLPGGGMKGVIDSRVILCGSTDLMRLMNVRIPFRLVDKTSVLLAVDGILCGIFNMKYTAKPQVREALIDLMRSNRHPVFAIRDFNVTPEMLHVAFDVATDGYDFPPYVERFGMSSAEPGEDSQIAAIICREGLGPLVHTADTARSMYSATRINTFLTAFSAFFGVIFAAVRLLGTGSLSIGFLFAFMFVFALLAAAVSFFNRV